MGKKKWTPKNFQWTGKPVNIPRTHVDHVREHEELERLQREKEQLDAYREMMRMYMQQALPEDFFKKEVDEVVKEVVEKKVTNKKEREKETMNIGEELIQQIVNEVEGRFRIPHDKLVAFVEEELDKRKPKSIVIKKKDLPEIKLDHVHQQFEKLLHLMACRVPVFITGPAGSGKTRAVEDAAKALALEFSAISVGPQTTQSHIMGYNDAVGKYVPTEFRKRFQGGGVFLIDEFDAGSPQVLTCLNSALAGNFCAFPDGMVQKHKDFLCIATGNTYGNGANRIYVGRNQLDGATTDRFVYLEWDYDLRLEAALCNNDEWFNRVTSVRNKVRDLGIRAIVSPRASIYGATLLQAGMNKKEVENMVLFKGLSDADRKRVQ